MQEVRQLFKTPEVFDKDNMPALNWKAPDVDALVDFLCNEKQFSEERVRSSIEKMAAAKNKANQNRMESFFKVRRVVQGCYVAVRLVCRDIPATICHYVWRLQVLPSAPKAKLGAKTSAKKKEAPSKVKGKVAKKLGAGKK